MCAEIFSGMLNSRMRGCEASEECGDWDCRKFGEFGGMCVDVKLERNGDGRDMVTFWKERGLKLEGTRMCEFDGPLKGPGKTAGFSRDDTKREIVQRRRGRIGP